MNQKPAEKEALTEIARAYLKGAGMTLRCELARVTGLSNPDAGMGNWALVVEGFPKQVRPRVYRLTDFDQRLAWRCWLLHSRRVSRYLCVPLALAWSSQALTAIDFEMPTIAVALTEFRSD